MLLLYDIIKMNSGGFSSYLQDVWLQLLNILVEFGIFVDNG